MITCSHGTGSQSQVLRKAVQDTEVGGLTVQPSKGADHDEFPNLADNMEMWYLRSATDAAGRSYNRHFQMRATSHWGVRPETGTQSLHAPCKPSIGSLPRPRSLTTRKVTVLIGCCWQRNPKGLGIGR